MQDKPNLALNNAQYDKIMRVLKVSVSKSAKFPILIFFVQIKGKSVLSLFIVIPNHVLKFLVRFEMKIILKYLVLMTKISKICEICLKSGLLIFWIDLD